VAHCCVYNADISLTENAFARSDFSTNIILRFTAAGSQSFESIKEHNL
jgi:hypothetical protein